MKSCLLTWVLGSTQAQYVWRNTQHCKIHIPKKLAPVVPKDKSMQALPWVITSLSHYTDLKSRTFINHNKENNYIELELNRRNPLLGSPVDAWISYHEVLHWFSIVTKRTQEEKKHFICFVFVFILIFRLQYSQYSGQQVLALTYVSSFENFTADIGVHKQQLIQKIGMKSFKNNVLWSKLFVICVYYFN